MVNKTVFVLFIFLYVYSVNNVECKKVYCSEKKNEFYLTLGDFCKECDMCNPGFGQEPFEVSKFEVTLEHGAMGCKRCKMCDKGSFNKRRSYGKCKPCRDCKSKGKMTKKICTQISNTKCGKKMLKENRHTTPKIRIPIAYGNKSTRMTEDSSSHPSTHPLANITTQTTDFLRSNKTNIVLLSIFLVLIIALLAAAFALYICVIKGKMKRRGESVQSVELGCTRRVDIDTDGEIQAVNEPLFGDSEVMEKCQRRCIALSDKQIMIVAKHIAARKAYRPIALDLNVPENIISIIEEENKDDCISTAYKCLQKWTQLYPENAYFSDLLRALENVGRRDLIISFCMKFQIELNNDSG